MTDLPTQKGAPVDCGECGRSETIRIRLSADGKTIEVVCVSCGARGEYGVWKGRTTEITAERAEQED